MKLKLLCLATGEIFENVEIIGKRDFPGLGEMLAIKECGRVILVNTDFVLTAESLYIEYFFSGFSFTKENKKMNKLGKIYRLALDEYDTPSTSFYISKEGALEELEDFKDKIKEEYIDTEEIDTGAMILLQTIDLDKSENLYMYEISEVISELTTDEENKLTWKDYI